MKALLTILATMLMIFIPVSQSSASTLPPCAEEDSINCYWDASTMGNGAGSSFENVEGEITYTTPVEEHTCAVGAFLTAERTCTFTPDPIDVASQGYIQASDGAWVAPEYLAEYEGTPVQAQPVEAVQPATSTSTDEATAWQLWDAVGASNLLPDSASTVTYLSTNTVGYPLTADTIIVWDNFGTFHQFHIG